MPPLSPPPGTPDAKAKNRKRLMIYAGAGVAILLILFLRGQGQSQAAAATDPNAASTTGTAVPTDMTGADQSGYVTALGDQVSSDLGGVSTALEDQSGSFQNLADAITGSQGTPGTTTTTDSSKQINRNLQKLTKSIGGLTKTVHQEQRRQSHANTKAKGKARNQRPANKSNKPHRKPQGHHH